MEAKAGGPTNEVAAKADAIPPNIDSIFPFRTHRGTGDEGIN